MTWADWDKENYSDGVDAKDALDKARSLIQYRSDREFIGKVLDAQVRVNAVETKMLKKAHKKKNELWL